MQTNASSETVLPRAVRLQVKTMQEHIDARKAPPSDPDPAPKPTDQPSLTPPASSDPPGPPSETIVVRNTPPTEAELKNQGNADYWRERFKVMQGINDRLRQEHDAALSTRDRQIADLTERIGQLETAAPRAPETPNIKLFFTDEQIDRFGEEQCVAMAAAAMTAARDQAQRIVEAEIGPLKQRTQNDDAAKAKQAQETFWANLDAAISKLPEAGNRTIWEINEEPGWLNWLREPDANGEQRQKHLTRYQRELNAQGVANLVAEYLRKAHAPTPTPPVAPGGGSGNGGEPLLQGQTVNGKGYPSPEEYREYTKNAATIRNPRDPRFITEAKRQEMEARLKLRHGAR